MIETEIQIREGTTKIPVEKIVANPWNPNRQSEAVSKATAESIEEFGFLDPVTGRWLHDGTFQIIDGEHRWRQAIELGHAEVEAKEIDGLSEAQAKRLTLILNETRGEHDVVAVGTLLANLQKDGTELAELLRGLPYSSTELSHLLSLADEDWDAFGSKNPEPVDDPDAKREIVRMHLDFTTAQHERFQRMLRRAGTQLDIEDPQEVVKVLVKRGYDSL